MLLQIKIGFFDSDLDAKESWDVDAKIGRVGLASLQCGMRCQRDVAGDLYPLLAGMVL